MNKRKSLEDCAQDPKHVISGRQLFWQIHRQQLTRLRGTKRGRGCHRVEGGCERFSGDNPIKATF